MTVEYRPFVPNVSVSSVGDPTKKTSVTILLDTGATQFLIVKGFVPCGSNLGIGDSVVEQGVSGIFVSVPLPSNPSYV